MLNMILMRAVCVIAGYFIGCIQTSYIVGKLIYKIDIREYGSGNAGMTNVARTMGGKAGAFVFAADALKAIVAYYLCALVFHGTGTLFFGAFGDVSGAAPGLFACAGVVLGHNFPFYMKFKGGKGVSSTAGTVFSVDIRVGLIVGAIFFGTVFPIRYISLSALLYITAFPFVLLIFGFPPDCVALEFVMAGVAFYMHRGNVRRLLNGTERKFEVKKKSG